MKIVGFKVGVSLWALKWACKFFLGQSIGDIFFGSIDRYRRDQYISVKNETNTFQLK